MQNILQTIIEHKQQELIQAKQQLPLSELIQQANQTENPSRGFATAIQNKAANKQSAIIAEIKKASPSKGVICENFNPAKIAQCYEKGGATCLSVLTDEKFFQGSKQALQQAKTACSLPILRKDFIIDPYQVYEAKLIGADCILLIVAALTDQQLTELAQLANTLDIDVLVEVHDAEELTRALKCPYSLIGINNRNLKTFKTTLDTTINLLDKIPNKNLIVTESGINTKADINLMQQYGVYSFLIGESLMREDNPGKKLAELINS